MDRGENATYPLKAQSYRHCNLHIGSYLASSHTNTHPIALDEETHSPSSQTLYDAAS